MSLSTPADVAIGCIYISSLFKQVTPDGLRYETLRQDRLSTIWENSARSAANGFQIFLDEFYADRFSSFATMVHNRQIATFNQWFCRERIGQKTLFVVTFTRLLRHFYGQIHRWPHVGSLTTHILSCASKPCIGDSFGCALGALWCEAS